MIIVALIRRSAAIIAIDLVPGPGAGVVCVDGVQLQRLLGGLVWRQSGFALEDRTQLALQRTMMASGQSLERREDFRVDIADMDRFHDDDDFTIAGPHLLRAHSGRNRACRSLRSRWPRRVRMIRSPV